MEKIYETKPLGSLFKNYELKKTEKNIRSERDELIQRFVDKGAIRVRRKGKLEPATAKEIAILLRDCPTSDLHAFYEECNRARSFSRWFWWSVKGGKTNR